MNRLLLYLTIFFAPPCMGQSGFFWSHNAVCGTTTVTDVDGNVYNTVAIGSQCWLKQNLATTKYNDGTAIPNVTDNAAWMALATGAYSWYNNDAATNKATYGALYNWFAVDNNAASKIASNGGKNICPAGWHVPSYAQWGVLENFLIANGYNYDGSTSGNKYAKSMASVTLWSSDGGAGTVGNSDYPAYRNKSGFSGLPGGIRSTAGVFDYMTLWGYWWFSSQLDAFPTNAYSVMLNSQNNASYASAIDKIRGHSVRCLKNSTEPLPCGELIVKDLDNNSYHTVQIGTQCWMKENLATTKYNDGSSIPNVTDNTAWSNLTTAGYSWYNNDAATYKAVYGGYYNWYVGDNNTGTKVASNGGKNVCPSGWHVPSTAQWMVLENYLIANGYNYDGTIYATYDGTHQEQNKIGKALASSGWTNGNSGAGAPGNGTFPENINKSGFTGLQGGQRVNDGTFGGAATSCGYWWCTNSYYNVAVTDKGWPHFIYPDIPLFQDNQWAYKNSGLNIRCLKD